MKNLWARAKAHKVATVVVAAFIVLAVAPAIRSIQSGNERLTEPLKKGSIVESVYGIGTLPPNWRFALKVGVTSMTRRLHMPEGDQFASMRGEAYDAAPPRTRRR